MSLLEIRDERVRNLVRGVLSAESDEVFAATMENLHRECGAEDAAAVGGALRRGLVFREGIPADFPETAADDIRTPYVQSRRLDVELGAQRERLHGEVDKLVQAITLVGELNYSLLARNSEAIERSFADYRSRFGTSLLIALKAISLRNWSEETRPPPLDDAPALQPFLKPQRQVVTGAFEATSNSDRDYMRARRSFVNFVEKNRLDHGDAAIVSDMLSPLKRHRFDMAHRLHAYGRRGLLDLVAFLFRARTILTSEGRADQATLIEDVIPSEVHRIWASTFRDVGADALQDVIGRQDQFHDLALFSHLPAWSEFPDLFDYRIRVERAVGPRLDGSTSLVARTAATLIAPAGEVRELLDEPVLLGLAPALKVPVGGFHRTIEVVSCVEAGQLDVPDGRELSELLDRTINVAYLLSTGEIEGFLPPRPGDPLYEYMRAALLNDAEEGPARNHALRRALQRLLEDQHGGDVVAFLASVDSPDGHVAQHFFNLCSEAFLTSLYRLYPDADGVMEAQTRLLEWWGENEDDDDAITRAKSHRLLIRLRKVRGSIEETRIYVDPLRMIEWMQEKLDEDLRALAPLAEEIIADQTAIPNLKDPVGNVVRPRLRLLKLLDRAYQEFCTNRIHGVASYIGRRIRHGTLHGHLSLDVKPEVEKIIAEFREGATTFADFLRRWMADFDAAVLEFARTRVHVKSKETPRGFIVAEIGEPDKSSIANAAIHAVATSLRDRPQSAHTFVLILDYCWYFFEIDLKRARAALEDLRRQYVIGVEAHVTGRSDLDARITDRIRELNTELGRRFEVAKSWLTRPTNFSPSASVGLLIEAVLDEVKQRYPCCAEMDLGDAEDIDLIGRGFHFFYDAVSILIVNAAKHGRPGGTLAVRADSSISDDERHILLSITVASQFAPGERDRRLEEIGAAMAAEVGDAMNRDEGTGLRKLKGLLEEVDEIEDFFWNVAEDTVSFTLDMRFLRS